ncbi:MAG: hypothetical protein A2X66_09720 [Ignavibacteria bacterium GWA2_54_16]|nr:MAG: hypothetical protein A2X66_09720 [Ignavibacteria bacterium GWA2_54_16]
MLRVASARLDGSMCRQWPWAQLLRSSPFICFGNSKTSFIVLTNPEVLNPASHGSNSVFKGGHGAREDDKGVRGQSQCQGSTTSQRVNEINHMKRQTIGGRWFNVVRRIIAATKSYLSGFAPSLFDHVKRAAPPTQ